MLGGGAKLKRSQIFCKGVGFEPISTTLDLNRRTVPRVQEAFFDNSRNGLDIIAATNAFGMGIDKADIRYIVHWTLTGTLEEYCQEVGRAGRDGEDAHCVLFFCHEDRGLHEWFIRENAPDKQFLLKLLKVVENFKGSDRYRTISNEELEWMSEGNATKILVSLSYLEKLGFLKRWYNVPSQLSVRFRELWSEGTAPADAAQQELLRQLRSGVKTILELCEAIGQKSEGHHGGPRRAAKRRLYPVLGAGGLITHRTA